MTGVHLPQHLAVRKAAAGGILGHQQIGRRDLLPVDVFTKTGRPVSYVLQEKHPDMRVHSVENPTCAAFEEYEEVPGTAPLELLEDDVMWVSPKISGAAGVLVAEAVDMSNWIL